MLAGPRGNFLRVKSGRRSQASRLAEDPVLSALVTEDVISSEEPSLVMSVTK